MIKLFCDNCDVKLEPDIKEIVSNKITEIVSKNAPLKYIPHDIYEITELDDCDIVKYDYIKYFVYDQCPICKRIYTNY